MTDSHNCPGVPDKCEHSLALISKLLEGMPTLAEAAAARGELSHCLPCVQKVDFQFRFKVAMAQHATEPAPPGLHVRINEALGRVDLADIDVTDL